MTKSNQKWHFMFEKDRSPFAWYFIIHAAATQQQPVCTRGAVFKTTHVCILEKDHRLVLRKIKVLLEKNPQYIDEVIAHADKQIQKLLERFIRLEYMDYQVLSNSQLKNMLKEYSKIVMRWSAQTLWIANLFDEIMTETLTSIQETITPLGETLRQQAEKELLQIASAPKANQETLLRNYALRYGWVGDYGGYNQFISANEFRDQLKSMKKDQQSDNERNTPTELIESKKPKLTTARRAIYFRNQRMDVFLAMLYHLRHLLFEIARRHHLALRNIVFLTLPEIITLLEGKNEIKKSVSARKKGYVIWFDGKDTLALCGKAAEEKNKLLGFYKLREEKLLKGMCAYKGKVIGKVKIVRTLNDAEKIEVGDILLTPMTTPSLVPFMRKASAIVTDEGGITCHAAIVSRELKIPCIIGTKIATKVLKDGDTIEVDTKIGVVRRLK